MKASCTIVASVLAASTVALSSGDTGLAFNPCSVEGLSSYSRRGGDNSSHMALSSSEKEKFAPKFDGLRFIETLVTAHR
ncbi:hypothetical protein LguiB_034910 [Lonicera macranthoides]